MVQNFRSPLLILPCLLPTLQTNWVYMGLSQSLMLLERDLFNEMCPWYLYFLPTVALYLAGFMSLYSSRVSPCPWMRLPSGYFPDKFKLPNNLCPTCCIKYVWCQKLVLMAWISAWKTLLFEWSLFLLIGDVLVFVQPCEITLAGSRGTASGKRSDETKKEGHRILT